MMIKNTKIEKKIKFEREVLFPQLKNNGNGIGNYITHLESKNDTLQYYIKEQRQFIEQLQIQLSNR